MRKHYIYKITNLVNQKIYIGQSVAPKKRWNRHLSDARYNRGSLHLTNAIRKYGEDRFCFEIIDVLNDVEGADKVEQEMIKQHSSFDREHGYNKALGGTSSRIVSEETKQKIRAMRTGTKASEETKKRMSLSMMGKNAGHSNGMYGRRGPLAKLTLFKAQKIREEYRSNETSMLKLAKQYRVSKKTILNIIHNRIYIS
ncbi:MAG: hypothetical protein CMB80_25560 [Flammeovirgaceae bacterium]|nr:hypothetical protein [Flammeovirgaceae bacterium]|tara:strand:- start:394 stop:987 length:594 start_codon:yes stop_codon:yes gene_type:complete